jgi:hypothetical protein
MLAKAKAASAWPEWAKDLGKAENLVNWGDYAGARKLYEKAMAKALESGMEKDPQTRRGLADSYYNLACIYSLASAGKSGPKAEPVPISPTEAGALKAQALECLGKALEFGWTRIAHIRRDSDLDAIRDDPEFEKLLAQYEGK